MKMLGKNGSSCIFISWFIFFIHLPLTSFSTYPFSDEFQFLQNKQDVYLFAYIEITTNFCQIIGLCVHQNRRAPNRPARVTIRGLSITRGILGGGGLKIKTFWALKWHKRCECHLGPKKSRFLGPPPLKCPSLWIIPPQNQVQGPYKQQVHW